MFALKSGNFSVSFFNGIFLIGQFFSIEISNILTLFLPNGTLSKAPVPLIFCTKIWPLRALEKL